MGEGGAELAAHAEGVAAVEAAKQGLGALGVGEVGVPPADRLVPPDESRHLYEHAGSPRRLVLLPGIGHFDWVMSGSHGFREVTDRIVRFLAEVVPAR